MSWNDDKGAYGLSPRFDPPGFLVHYFGWDIRAARKARGEDPGKWCAYLCQDGHCEWIEEAGYLPKDVLVLRGRSRRTTRDAALERLKRAVELTHPQKKETP